MRRKVPRRLPKVPHGHGSPESRLLGARMLERRLLGWFVGGVALLAVVPAAQAQVTVERCEGRSLRGAECGIVAVPLNHASPPPSGRSIRLAFVRFRAQGRRRGTVVFLAGGPGQAATTIAGQAARGELR